MMPSKTSSFTWRQTDNIRAVGRCLTGLRVRENASTKKFEMKMSLLSEMNLPGTCLMHIPDLRYRCTKITISRGFVDFPWWV
jgi:hypothetical protein